MSADQVLAKIDGAKKLLSEAKTIQEAKHIADIAEAARVYAKRVESSIETVNYAAEVKVRAERLLGEMLQQTPKHPGHKFAGGSAPQPPAKLEDIGITKDLSSKAQQLASVPVAKFEEAIEEQKAQGKELSTAATLKRIMPGQVILSEADEAACTAASQSVSVWPGGSGSLCGETRSVSMVGPGWALIVVQSQSASSR